MKPSPRLLYVSCAPRVSLRPTAENLAARNHINSVMDAFKSHSFKVKKFILGDILPPSFSDSKSQEVLTKSNSSRILSDIIRIGFRILCQPFIFFKHVWGIDFVYERFGSFQAGGFWLKLAGKTWILESNAILYEESFKESKSIYLWRLARYFEKRAYQSCNILVVVSNSLKEGIVSEFGVDPDKIVVLNNAVNTEFFKPFEVEDKPTEKIKIGYAGSLVKWQSLDKLLKSISTIEGSLRDKLEVIIVGDGPERNNLESLSEELGLSSMVKFAGRVPFEEMPQVMNEFDVGFCYPNHDSSSGKVFNSPMKLYEYLSMGKPIISVMNDDLKSMQHFENFTFMVESANDLKNEIENIIRKQNELTQMGELARTTVIDEHSWHHRLIKLLNRLENHKSNHS